MNGSLIVPVSFTEQDSQDILQPSCDSEALSLDSWGIAQLSDESDQVQEAPVSQVSSYGAVLGYSDGSIVLFHPKYSKSSKATSLTSPVTPTAPYRYPMHLSLTNSRTTSPSSSKANLTAISTSKSRAVSGLSKEQVEAPKNYVDFDEEPEKLKDMLGDRVVKEKQASDSFKPVVISPVVADRPRPHSRNKSITSTSEVDPRRADDARSLMSIDSSLSHTPVSPISHPSSPRFGPTMPQVSFNQEKFLGLKSRIVPRKFGEGHGQSCLRVLDGESYFLSLQESG